MTRTPSDEVPGPYETIPTGMSGRSKAPTRLRGREPELDALLGRLEDLSDGHGNVVLIRGAAGLGKSALLGAVEDLAERRGFAVYHGAASVAGQAVPLEPLLDALISSREQPAVDPEVLRQLGGSVDQRYWLLRELQDGLERAAQASPVIVAIDDIQWADAATLAAIGILPRRLMASQILWLFVVRSGDLPTPVRLAIERMRVQDPDILTLGRLGETAVQEVARDLLGGAPDDRLIDVIDRVSGQPLWLVELLRGLKDEQLIEVEGGVAHLIGDRIPRRLLESIADQLARLSVTAREGLQMAAVLGRRFSLDELAALMDQPPSHLLGAVRESLAAGLVVDDGERLAFRHDLVREAIEATLPGPVKRSLQRRALDVALEHGAPLGDLATLALQVARPGDLHAIGLLERAAQEIGRVSPTVAAPLSQRVLDLLSPTDPRWDARFVETIDLLVHSGQASEAERSIALNAPRMTNTVAEASARLTLGTLELQYGPGACAEQCRMGLELAHLPASLRVALLTLRACGLEMLGDIDAAEKSATEARDEAAAFAGSFDEVVTLPARALVAYDRGRWREAIELAERGVRDSDRADIPAPRAWLFDAWLALIHIAVGQLDQALELVNAGTLIDERDGVSANLRIWSMLRARVMLGLGRFTDATAEAEAIIEMSDEMGEGGRGYINHIAAYVLGCAATHTGDAAGLRSARTAAIEMRKVDEGRAQQLATWMLAQLAAVRGDQEELAGLDLCFLDPLLSGRPYASSPRRYLDHPALVRVLLRAGREPDAADVTKRLAAVAEEQPDFPYLQATSAQARALVRRDEQLAEEAVGLFEGCQEPLIRARAFEDAGTLHADRGVSARAVDRLDGALAIYTELGATRDSARVRGLLRRLGARRPSPVGGESTAWPELSDSEVAVVRFVAAGATNREVAEQLFLSPHTVNAHLRQVFSKLGIRSRVQLARLAAQREPEQSE
jgi:DNA-binding CsgD family transcriptional regulator